MAVHFQDPSSEYLETSSTPVTATPFTMSVWFYQDDSGANCCFMGLADASVDNQVFMMDWAGAAALNPRFLARTSGVESAVVSNSASVNTWHNFVARSTSATDRDAVLDGDFANKGTNTVSTVPTGIDTFSVGRIGDSTPGEYMSGRLAESAMWNVALSDDDISMLAAGYSALFVRPDALVYYDPLVDLSYYDRFGGLTLSAGGTPFIAEHPPIYYPASPGLIRSAAVAAGGLPAPYYYQQLLAG